MKILSCFKLRRYLIIKIFHHFLLMQEDFSDNQNNKEMYLQTIEDIFLDNFIENLQNERLLNLPIQSIYDILGKYEKSHGKQQYQNEILEFLFKCLDKYGRDASPLFQFAEFNCDNLDHFNKLITQYSDIVDFQFLNSSFAKMIHQTQIQYSSLVNENAQMKSKIFSLNEEKGKIDQLNDELTKKKIEYEQKIDQLTKSNDQLQKKLQNESFEIGEIVLTSKNLSKDESWLECNGRNVSQNDYPDLFDVLPSNTKGEWQEQLVNVPVNAPGLIEGCDFYSLVTNGEFTVFTGFKVEEKRTFLYIYSKRYAKNLWAKNIFEFPKGEVGGKCRMQYIKNEFLIFVLVYEENNLCLYSVHSNNPENGWKKKLNYSNNCFSCKRLFICDFNYLNNLYVVSFNVAKTNTEHYNSYIAYGSNISSEFEMNMNFCDQESSYFGPFITYGNNRWILCVECDLDSCIYVSDDISSLSPISQKNIFHHGNSSDDVFTGFGVIFKNDHVIIPGIFERKPDSGVTIFYSHIDENYAPFYYKQISEHVRTFISPIIYFGGKFILFCYDSKDFVKIYCSNGENLSDWELIQTSKNELCLVCNYFSVAEIKNNLFCSFNISENIFFTLSTTIGSIKQLPENSEAKNLTAYIKALK